MIWLLVEDVKEILDVVNGLCAMCRAAATKFKQVIKYVNS
jgi:hypothetical protein